MKYILLVETTDWDIPNHIYVADEKKQKIFGYFPRGEGDMIKFNKPLPFYSRGRTFKTKAFSA